MTRHKPGAAKAARPARNIDQEIAAAEEKARQLRAKKRDDERKALERNQRAIMVLLREAALDQVAAATWCTILPALTKLLQPDKVAAKQVKLPAPPPTLAAAPQSEPPAAPQSAASAMT